MATDNLEATLKTTEIETAKWRSSVEHINAQITDAMGVVKNSEARRAQNALSAANGDAAAIAAMAKIRKENDSAEKDIADLRLALPEAQRHLANAEQVEGAARRALSRQLAQGTMLKRISVAAQIDKVFAELEAVMKEYDAYGVELHGHHLEMLSTRGYSFGSSVSQMEGLTGQQRVMAALPPIFGKLFPTVSRGERRASLAVSEAEFWSLQAPAESVKVTA